ncbi:MAG: HAMP domain-containing sensor histidine kinase [Eubacteriales bacterium]|nr:HAMP domain-containing sensor histidine kinase [Eubacteriales bacterium]
MKAEQTNTQLVKAQPPKRERRRRRRQRSIRTRMTVIFSAVLIVALASCWLANIFFLENYYVRNKLEALVEAYETLDQASREQEMGEESFLSELKVRCEADNISLFVMGSDGRMKLTTVRDSEELRKELYEYVLGAQLDERSILGQTDAYVMSLSGGSPTGGYLTMMGVLDQGELFIIRTAVEPLRESVMLANRFLIYVGCVVLLVGAFIIHLVSRRISEPILELARLSERMSNLDFNVKFSGGKDEEIVFLGSHMNRLSETLERTISELKTANNELQRDIEQKEKRDEMRKEFLSNVSHELKTPIALIQGYAEGLQECINDDAESREFYCEVIMDEASKMNNLVKNLLTLNELEFGSEVVTMERFDLTSMIRNMLRARQVLFDQKGVRLVFDVNEPVYAWGNEFKLEQVLNNYISNALNHVEGERIIKITLQKTDGHVRTGVFNTGSPIPEADVGRIWDKFYKVDKARTREYGGSGVGLSIVKAIMESMHQRYGVVNYDNGVEFWFELDDRNET